MSSLQVSSCSRIVQSAATSLSPSSPPAHELQALKLVEPAPSDRVLFNEDTFSMIVHFVHESGDHDGRASLARLARTAKGLHFTAVRTLWHTMNSLVPLFKLLQPTVKWQKKFRIYGGVLYVRQRPRVRLKRNSCRGPLSGP